MTDMTDTLKMAREALPAISPHDHPDPHTMAWTESEIRWIKDYAARAAIAAIDAKQAAPVALTDAEIDAAVADIFIGDFEPGPYYDRAIARAVLAAAGAAAQGGDRG